MKLARILFAAATCATLTACAGLPPSTAEISKAPKIQFGQTLPEGDNYVLHFPAGTPLPVSTVVDGNLFEHEGQATLHVTLKRDVYMFRQFASFDGQNWQPARKLIETHLELRIPQKDGSNAGYLHIQMDQK
ncbi:hypothetical protein FGKAn22_15500 [Ferrigenium kumadai]|uniref:Lipoprotein n=1 Tax=Ferrigenium kumadai TaxID=1682490 RepID=A0AAN1W0W7_9PROT|nr:hypothetical protein [Ferrigenium kumadai]BBI99857.1 hypothetical protein FGKAn22_15500 [Ferrigenium kumadai]